MSETANEKRNYHHGDLYNALIQSGTEVIREKGVGSLSLREVAKVLGVSHTAPYRHFKDKNALMVAIAQKAYDKLGEEMGLISTNYDKNPVDRIVECGCKYVEYTLENKEFASLMFSGQYSAGKAFQFSYEDNSCFQIFVRLFEEAQEQSLVAETPASIQALSVWTSVHGLMMLFVSGQIPALSDSREQILKLATVMQTNIIQSSRISS